MKTDIVIPYGRNTKAQSENDDLKYCLRSIEKYVTGFNNIWIVGDDPGFTKGINILPAENKYGRNRERNIFHKLSMACQCDDVSENFAMWNSDYFIIKPFDVSDIPYYQRGQLYSAVIKRKMGDTYRQSLHNTMNALRDRGLTSYHYDIHYPIIYNKELFLQTVGSYDWENTPWGFVIKSLYCNTLSLVGPYMRDCKIEVPWIDWQLREIIKERKLFSTGAGGMNDAMHKLLKELYPEACGYEKKQSEKTAA